MGSQNPHEHKLLQNPDGLSSDRVPELSALLAIVTILQIDILNRKFRFTLSPIK